MTKPIVDIADAVLSNHRGSAVLMGIPTNHPNENFNFNEIVTSEVIMADGNTVETKNTIYNVLSWYKDKDQA